MLCCRCQQGGIDKLVCLLPRLVGVDEVLRTAMSRHALEASERKVRGANEPGFRQLRTMV
jgi:hypothetical protein